MESVRRVGSWRLFVESVRRVGSWRLFVESVRESRFMETVRGVGDGSWRRFLEFKSLKEQELFKEFRSFVELESFTQKKSFKRC